MINPTLNRCFPLFWCAILVQLFCISHLNAQTVIGGDTIDQSAILDIQDTAKGVLLTRLTTTQRNAIPKPAFGLLILNTTRKCLEANIGSPDTPDWRCLTTGIPKISEVDTAYWNRKLGAEDTLSLSARINAKLSPGDTLSLSNRIDGKLSSFTESDPVFNSSIAKGISGADTLYWNRKLDAGDTLSLSARINAKLSQADTLSLSSRINSKLSSFTESDPVFNSSIAKGITGADTLYWNRKLGAGDTLSLSARINAKLSPGDTLSLSNRIESKLSSFTESDPVFNSSIAKGITGADTVYWNRKLGTGDTISLSARINAKLSPVDTLSLSNRIDGKLSSFTESDPVFNSSIAKGISGTDTLYWNRKLGAGDTLSLSARINAKLSPADTLSLSNRIDSKLSSFTENDPVFNSSIAKGITGADTLYWNRKLDAGDTLSLSARIDARLSPVDTLSLSSRINSKLSSFTESDPVFNSSIAKGITGADTLYWNRKLDAWDTVSLSARINAKLSPADTLSLSNRIDSKLSSFTESDPVFNSSIAKGITGADTVYWNRKLGTGDTMSLSARINAKLSPVDTLSLSNRIDGKLSSYTESDPVFNSSIAKGITGTDTLYWNRKLDAGDTLSLSARINAKLSPADTLSLSNRINSKLSSFTESDPVFNSSIAKGISGADTLYWNRKLDTGDTLSLSARINAKLSPVDTLSLSNRIDGKLSSFTESDPAFNSSVAKGITGADTLYWNRKLSAGDTISLSNRIDSKVGLPQSGNTPGTMLYWSGLEWVKVSPGQPGQALTLSQEGFPVWTGPALANLTTDSPTSIMQTSVTVGGNVISDGGASVTERGIVWSNSLYPTFSNSVLNFGAGTGNFSGSLTNLIPNSTYYFRAFAVNKAGIAYGNQNSFVTLSPATPTLSTREIINITNSSAVSGGIVTNNGGKQVTARGVVWSTTPNPTLQDDKTIDNSGSELYSSFIAELEPNTTYYVRAFATNEIGTNYGNELIFHTASFPKMINIPAGTFAMGCTPGDENCGSSEIPQHNVILDQFEISESELTQEQWQSVMGNNPNISPSCTNCPVNFVSWFDAVVFCNRLSELYGLTPCYYSDPSFLEVYGKIGDSWFLWNSGTVYWNSQAKGFRLPTEAEWEKAARGGNSTYIYSGSNNIDEVGWNYYNAWLSNNQNSRPVKGKNPNGFGLYDMSGNVYEWCWNWFEGYSSLTKVNPIGPSTGANRILRSGSWNTLPNLTRVSNRYQLVPNERNHSFGFRLARTP